MVENAEVTETVAPVEEVKDFDLEAFIAEIGKENPDMSVIKAGVEKFGTGKMTDEQKNAFLDAVFPRNENKYLAENQAKPLGFENTKGIENTLKAVRDLQSEGKLSADQVKDVVSVKYPPNSENGKNMAMAIALNVRAAEFKSGKLTNPDDKAIVDNNLKNYQEALGVLGQIEKNVPGVLKESMTASYRPESMNRDISLAKLAERSPTLSQFAQDPAAYQPALTVDGAEVTNVGGNEGVTVNSADKGVTVESKPNEENQTAEVSQGGNDKSPSGKPFEFEKVREQDIVQYMFEHWFLEGVSMALKAPFWLLNKAIDALEGRFDTSMPKAPKSAEHLPKNWKSIAFMNDAGKQISNAQMASFNNQADYLNKLVSCVSDNIGKPAEQWKVPEFDGKPLYDLNSEVDKAKIDYLNNQYNDDPDKFKATLKEAAKLPKEDLKDMEKVTRVASQLAVANYMANHLNEDFSLDNPECKKSIADSTIEFTKQIVYFGNQITARTEAKYRKDHDIAPDAKLTASQIKEISKETEKSFGKFVDEISSRGKTLKSKLNDYYQENLPTDRERIANQVENARIGMNSILAPDHLDEICPPQINNSNLEKPIGLYGAAIDFNNLEKKNNRDNAAMERLIELGKNRERENQQRKELHKQRVKEILNVPKNAYENVKGSVVNMIEQAKGSKSL